MRRLARLCVLAGGVAASACSNTTGGDLITLPFTAGGVQRDATQPFTFTTPVGWTVTLSQALIAVGPLYFNVDQPSTGLFRSGVVIVEATEQVIVDPLDPAQYAVPGGADGETGEAISVEIGLLAPDSTNRGADPTDAETLGGSFGVVAGTAVNGAMTVPFAGAIAVNQSLVTPTEPLADLERIRGAAVDLDFAAAPQTLELRIDPTHWFDQSDFSATATGAEPAGGFTWTVDSTFAAQVLDGVKSESGVYAFDLAPAAP
jgi:hypothetical protein